MMFLYLFYLLFMILIMSEYFIGINGDADKRKG